MQQASAAGPAWLQVVTKRTKNPRNQDIPSLHQMHPAEQASAEGPAWLQVVTKRTKNLKKQDIPSLDDPISKLNHIGKETVKKLNELHSAAAEQRLDLQLPPDLHRCMQHAVPAAQQAERAHACCSRS